MLESQIGLSLVELHLPDRPINIAGIVAHDEYNDRVIVVMRRKWHRIAPPEDVEVLSLYEESLRAFLKEIGREAFLYHIRTNFSHTIRISNEYLVDRPAGDLECQFRLLLNRLTLSL